MTYNSMNANLHVFVCDVSTYVSLLSHKSVQSGDQDNP